MTVGVGKNQSFTVSNSGGAPVVVSNIAITGGGAGVSVLTTPFTLAPQGTHVIDVNWRPVSTGSLAGNVVIQADNDVAPALVALSGTAAAAAHLVKSTATLDFGTVVLGTKKTATFTLTNSGGYPLTISELSFTDSRFSAPGLGTPLTLAPQG